MNAPRNGPDARAQSTGGPACSSSPSPRPSASRADRTSTRVAPADSIAATARALAPRRRGSPITVASASAWPAGGRQGTSSVGTPWSRTASESNCTPAVTTPAGVPNPGPGPGPSPGSGDAAAAEGWSTGMVTPGRVGRGPRGWRRSSRRGPPRRPRAASRAVERGPAGRRECPPGSPRPVRRP